MMTLGRRALVVMLLAGLAAVGMRVTVAAFSGTTANAGNSYAAGTVNLTDNDTGAMLSLSSAVAGATDTSCVRLTYNGSLDANVRHYATVAGTLAPYLSLKVTRGRNSSGFDNCTGFTEDTDDHIGAGPGVIYDGKLSSYPTSWAGGIVDPTDTMAGIGTYSPTILGTSGLVSYWRLGEASGTTAGDSKGTNNGTYATGSTLGATGALTGDANTAVTLNGTSGRVEVPNQSSLQLNGSFSIEAWIKPSSLTGNRYILHKDTFYYLYLSGSDVVFGFRGGAAYKFVIAAGAATVGSWQHFVGTYDGTMLRIYRNGLQVASAAQSGAVDTGAGSLFIGAFSAGGSFFPGTIDEAALYSAALTGSQVTTHYYAGVPAPVGAETWTAAETHDYKFQITLDNDAAALGKSASAIFNWEAQNT
jgi:hypothetical protein